jgi:aspartate 1-decarboxylase
MTVEMFRAKIHRAMVTEAELEYEGSLAVDPHLLEAAGLLVGEKVQVVNLNNGARFETYLILGDPGGICLNGPAARLGLPGDRVIIIAYAQMTMEEARKFVPQIVMVDEKNQIVSTSP